MRKAIYVVFLLLLYFNASQAQVETNQKSENHKDYNLSILSKDRKSLNSGFEKVRLLNSKLKFEINNISLSAVYSQYQDTSNVAKGEFQNLFGIYSYSGSAEISMLKIPFRTAVSRNNGIYALDNTRINDMYQFRFDPGQYKSLLQNQVMSKIKLEVLISGVHTRINEIRYKYEGELKSEISKIKSDFLNEFDTELDVDLLVADITVKDLSSLRTKLFSGTSGEKYREEVEKLNNFPLGDSLARSKFMYEC